MQCNYLNNIVVFIIYIVEQFSYSHIINYCISKVNIKNLSLTKKSIKYSILLQIFYDQTIRFVYD